jgi:predicted Fe-Mo cluster-binding NifX family protein
MERIIVVPTFKEGGIQSIVNSRFGRTESFTFIKLKENQITAVFVLSNSAIQSMNRIGVQIASLMREQKVTDAIVRKIGPNLFFELKQLNIRIFSLENEEITVKDALDLYINGKLNELRNANVSPNFR